MEIEFPMKKYGENWRLWQKHYHRTHMQDMHFNYILQLFKNSGCKIELFDPEKSPLWQELSKVCGATKWEVRINGKPIIIDHSDHLDILPLEIIEEIPCFKFHYHKEEHKGIKGLYPLSPINFTKWNEYEELVSKIQYNPTTNGLIMNNQRRNLELPKKRREKVERILKENFKDKASTEFYGASTEAQKRYWLDINNALVSVHVPGARNNMLDRGQGQLFGFGVCTISPKLVTILAEYTELENEVHYIACEDDYSDLVDIVKWCQTHIDECKKIGNNAQLLFKELLMPSKLLWWINKCME